MSQFRKIRAKKIILCAAFLMFGGTSILQPAFAYESFTWGVEEGDSIDYMCYSLDFDSNNTESYGSTYEILSIENDTIKGNFIKDQETMIDNDVICEVNMTTFVQWVARMVAFFPLPINESAIRANLQELCNLYDYANYSLEFIEGAQMFAGDRDFQPKTELNVTINENGVVARWETEYHLYELEDNPFENFFHSIDGFSNGYLVGFSALACIILIYSTRRRT